MLAFFSKLQYTDPTLYAYVKHWPLTVFVPAILILLAVLAFVTRRWDEHDRRRVADVADQTAAN